MTSRSLVFAGLCLTATACSRGTESGLDGFGTAQGSNAGQEGDGGHEGGSDDGEISTSGPASGGGPGPGAEDDGGGPGGAGDCCTAQMGPGCGDAAVAMCVCADDAFCCENVWDDLCASMVVSMGCGHCEQDAGGSSEGGVVDEGGDPSGGDPSGGESSDGDPSGGDPSGGDPSGGDPSGGDPSGGGEGDCCAEQAVPGCADAAVQDCVCAQDSYCCRTAWDDVCVGEVDTLGCGSCGGAVGTDGGGGSEGLGGSEGGGSEGGVGGDCCAPQGAPGCADAEVQECVCAGDAWCCDTEWDQLCVNEVTDFGCGSC